MKALDRAIAKIEEQKKTRPAAQPTPNASGANTGANIPYTPNPHLRDTDIVSAPAFPLYVLPAKHQDIIGEAQKYLSYPPDFTAVGMIAAASIAVGRTHTFNNGMWHDGACIYLAVVAPPGTKKSHPVEFALLPCIEANKRAIRKYNKERNLSISGGGTGEVSDEQFIYSDFTIETLTRGLKKYPRGVSVYIDELKAWFQNFNRYNAGSEQEFWLMNWSGKTIALNRSNYKNVLDRTYIPVVGTIQPGLLEDIGKGGRNLSGFIERILFCYPDHVEITPYKRRRDRTFDIAHQLQMRYTPLVTRLLDMTLSTIPDDSDAEEIPVEVICEEAAEDILTDFLNNLQDRIKTIDNEYVRNIYSKMHNYVGRFTLLLHLMHESAGEVTDRMFNPSGEVRIGTDIVKKAIALTEYFLVHGLKAQNQINSSTPLDRLPQNIRRWYAEIPSGQEVSTDIIENITIKHGLSRATMFNYLGETDPRKKLFLRARHGYYEKLYHQ